MRVQGVVFKPPTCPPPQGKIFFISPWFREKLTIMWPFMNFLAGKMDLCTNAGEGNALF